MNISWLLWPLTALSENFLVFIEPSPGNSAWRLIRSILLVYKKFCVKYNKKENIQQKTLKLEMVSSKRNKPTGHTDKVSEVLRRFR